MRKIKLYCIYSLVGLIQVLNPILSNAQTHEVIPPSPTAAALGKYVDNPVSLYTGKPVINIPLFDLQVKDFTLPISLSYNAGGIQVGEIASNVGLGWSLNAGGVIARVVQGTPDDKEVYGLAGDYHKVGMLLHDKNDFSLVNSGESVFYNYYTSTGNDYQLYRDTDPDIFYFNFCGIQGKFFFKVTNGVAEIKSIPYQGLVITHQMDVNNEIIAFTITDKNGVKYFFNEIENTELVQWKTPFIPQVDINPSQPPNYGNITELYGYDDCDKLLIKYNSSWYLSRIETPSGDDISFTYETDNDYYLNQPAEQSWGNYFFGNYNPNDNPANTYTVFYESASSISAKRISKIESENAKLELSSTSRLDESSKAINSITIYSKSNSISKRIKKWKLYHSYFESDQTEDIYYRPGKIMKFSDLFSYKDCYYRLKLTQLKEFGETDDSYQPPYTFAYSNNPLPHRFSFQRDLWGYYNACDTNKTLIPALNVNYSYKDGRRFSVYGPNNGHEFGYLKGANRLPNPSVMDAGMLIWIDYPTGGSTKYEYEPHEFRYAGENLIGGGVRIKSITKYYDNYKPAIKYNYSYTVSEQEDISSGSVMGMPVFAEYQVAHRCLSLNDPSIFTGLKTFSQSQSNLGSTQGSRIGYKRVVETISGNGKTVYSFGIPEMSYEQFPVIQQELLYEILENDKDLVMNIGFKSDFIIYGDEPDWFIRELIGEGANIQHNYLTPWFGCLRSNAYNPNEIYSDFESLDDPSPSLSYPYPPRPNLDWNRGQLLSKEYFDENTMLVKKDTFAYDVYYPYGNTDPSEVYGIKIGSMWSGIEEGGINNEYYSLFRCGKYKYLTDVARVLSSKEKRVYDLDDNTKYVSKLTSYTYNNFGQVQTVLTTDSKGDEMKTQYQYPGDYNNYSSANMPDEEYARGIHVARYKNIINKPIETVRLKNNKVTGASLLLYRSEGSLQNGFDLFPYQTYELEWSEPVSDFSYSTIDYEGSILKFSKNFRYKLVNTFGPFDQKHNILQISKNNDLDHSYIWGYNGQYPVAKITNSKIKNSYFQNFENPTNEENTSWLNNINSAHQTITSDNSISGNKSLYVLSSTNMSNYAMSLNLTNAEIDVDKSYTFSAWAWAPVGHDDVNIQFKYFDGASWHNLAKTSYSGNGEWQLLRVTQDFSGFSNVQRIEAVARNYGSNGKICYWDDIRLHPANAQMSTYTYKPLVGMTSETGPDNKTAYYEYDDLGRLTHVKDYKNNIINRYRYRYDGEAFSITIPDLPDDLEVNKDNLLFNLSGGTQTFEITSKVDWTITFEGDIAGLDVTPVNGSGNATIQVTCGAWDPAAPPRIVPLTITGGGLTEEVHVVQVIH